MVGNSILFDSSMKDLVEFRKDTLGKGMDLIADPWIWSNVKGDLFLMGFHFVFWSAFLLAIEKGLGRKL